MWMLVIALVLTLLKYLAVEPLDEWSWWWFLAPYGLTAAWWSYADMSGLTKRRAVEAEDARRLRRIARQKQALDRRRPR